MLMPSKSIKGERGTDFILFMNNYIKTLKCIARLLFVPKQNGKEKLKESNTYA